MVTKIQDAVEDQEVEVTVNSGELSIVFVRRRGRNLKHHDKET